MNLNTSGRPNRMLVPTTSAELPYFTHCNFAVAVSAAGLPLFPLCLPPARPLQFTRPLRSVVVCLIRSWTTCVALLSFSNDDYVAPLMPPPHEYMKLASFE